MIIMLIIITLISIATFKAIDSYNQRKLKDGKHQYNCESVGHIICPEKIGTLKNAKNPFEL